MWVIFIAPHSARASDDARRARLAAAIEVLADIEARRRPAADALKDWGLSHRFAGSGDRAAIAGPRLRRAAPARVSSAHVMGEASPRAIVLGMLRLERELDPDAIAALADGARFAPAPLSEAERARLEAADLAGAPPWVAGDYPEWLDPHLARVFGEERAAEGAALASRAPLDLRVNALKADREKAAAALADLDPQPTRWSPLGLRIALDADAKNPAIHAEPAFIKGLIEVQDEGSQLAALLAGAKPGEQVVDLCAGAGGKTLALAAAMETAARSTPPIPTSAGSRRSTRGSNAPARAMCRCARRNRVRQHELADLAGRADLVLIDAPCTGIGAWRRNPDAKWRVRPGALRGARQGAGRGARSRGRAGEAGRPHRLCHLLGAGRGERRRRCAHSSRAIRVLPSCRRPRSRTRWASAPICSGAPC